MKVMKVNYKKLRDAHKEAEELCKMLEKLEGARTEKSKDRKMWMLSESVKARLSGFLRGPTVDD